MDTGKNIKMKRTMSTVNDGLLPPYEYDEETFEKLIDEHNSGGAAYSQKYNGKIDYKLVNHIERIKYMSFGVPEWLFKKALNGCKESLWKLEYSYNLYSEVIAKAKEEGLKKI